MLLIRIVQFAIFMAIIWANIYFQMTENGYIATAWGICAAYALTVIPVQIYDWWRFRDARRAEYAERAKRGLPSGWQRHLPGAYARAARTAIDSQQRLDKRG